MNPFLHSFMYMPPLSEDIQQQLYLNALLKVVKQGSSPETPTHLPVDRLRRLWHRGGPESLFTHPADLKNIFAGVTQTVYQAIAELYCTPLGRSISTVWRIVKALSKEAWVTPPSYEAIWAICLSFEKQREEMLTVRIKRGSDIWWLGQLTLHCAIRTHVQQNMDMISPRLCLVINCSTNQVVAYKLASGETEEEQLALVLYEAFLMRRYPSENVPFGLRWSPPQQLITDHTLPRECHRACRKLGVAIESRSEQPELARLLLSNWAAKLVNRTLLPRQCILLLEAYLTQYAPPGPLHFHEERERQYGYLLSYQRDPTWHFPLLRTFLPRRQATITTEGTLVFQGLHYTDPLLDYWPGASVSLRFSPTVDTLIWVYLEEEILCQAYARERRPQEERHRALHAGRK